MIPARERPAYTADERIQLVGWLDLQRGVIHWKCEGFTEDDAHRSVLPTSPPRHAGHVDAIRELLDGARGYY